MLAVLITGLVAATPLMAETDLERPHWSLEAKGGLFIPALDNWSAAYGRRDAPEYGGSLAYKITRQFEVGIEAASIVARGQAFAPLHGTTAGSVTYDAYPLNAFVLMRGVFSENQWLIPYAGGGWTRMFYREKVSGQGIARGSVDGYHARAGIQILLDGIDPSAANSFYLEYGVYHTFLFIEAERIKANVDTATSGSVDLGGTSWLSGFLFEF